MRFHGLTSDVDFDLTLQPRFVMPYRVSASLIVLSVLLPAAALLPASLCAQETVFSASQAETGRVVYERSCADCHAPNLEGDLEASALIGPNFENAWGDAVIEELLEVIVDTMPEDAPGSLSDGQYAAIVAYIIQRNGGSLGTGRVVEPTMPKAAPRDR